VDKTYFAQLLGKILFHHHSRVNNFTLTGNQVTGVLTSYHFLFPSPLIKLQNHPCL